MTTTQLPGPSREEELLIALKGAAIDPSPMRIAAVLSHISDKDIRSEFSRRLNARRTSRRGGNWLHHYPERPHCQCDTCRAKRQPVRHKHRAVYGSHHAATESSPGCKDKNCKQPHVISRCECGALGVACARYPYVRWHKGEGHEAA